MFVWSLSLGWLWVEILNNLSEGCCLGCLKAKPRLPCPQIAELHFSMEVSMLLESNLNGHVRVRLLPNNWPVPALLSSLRSSYKTVFSQPVLTIYSAPYPHLSFTFYSVYIIYSLHYRNDHWMCSFKQHSVPCLHFQRLLTSILFASLWIGLLPAKIMSFRNRNGNSGVSLTGSKSAQLQTLSWGVI